jgi:hypothetical protein
VNDVRSNGVPPTSMSASIVTFQSRNADASLWLLRHPKKGSFKTTVTPFSRSGRSVVRSASLAKGGTSKKRPSPRLTKFRLGVIRRVHELCKRPSYFQGRVKSCHGIPFRAEVKSLDVTHLCIAPGKPDCLYTPNPHIMSVYSS